MHESDYKGQQCLALSSFFSSRSRHFNSFKFFTLSILINTHN